ncbi:MAG TPA: DUF1015 domain-containing protein, partial [Thermomicrobiales bacterium]|nr:DUF1015 domain-containing protein [Thermomicrobiales bacterium]
EPADGAEFSIRNIESVDLGSTGDPHALAARRYRAWLEQGALRQDAVPMVYIHRHRFDQQGTSVTRTGLLARVRLTDWTERVVLPHEQTTRGPREERLNRLRAVQANLSPLYLLFRDADSEIRGLIGEHAGSGQLLDNRDQMGGTHHLTAVADAQLQARLSTAFARRTLFVADGHHRYEAALAYRDECRARRGFDPDAPWEFVLALLAPVEDPGVIVWPTHRVLLDEQHGSPRLLLRLIQRWFDASPQRLDAPLPDTRFICRVVLPDNHGVWDVHAKPGDPHQALMPHARGGAWRSLGVAAVESLIESLLGVRARAAEPRLLPAIDDADAVEQIMDGRAQAAFLLPAPSLDQLLTVAEGGDLLPAKSTWFEPKAPAGLVINDLRA